MPPLEKYANYENFENKLLDKTDKSQSNFQFNSQYTFKAVNVGETTIKSRIIGSYELRNYVSEYYDYTDNMYSARLEMTF